MKKILIFTIISALLLGVFAFCACVSKDDGEYTLVAPDGAPSLAIACLPSQISGDSLNYKINKRVVSSGVINTKAVGNDANMAIVPANLASIIYNKSGDYKILAVVTNGNLYMTSSISCDVASLKDLKGKIVYSIGQLSVPDTIFKTLLARDDIPYAVSENSAEGRVTIKYCKDASEVVSRLALAKSKGELVFGVYGEPAVTNSKAKGFQEVFDLQALWSATQNDVQKGYAQAVLIARKKVCKDKTFVANLLQAFSLNEDSIMQDPSNAVRNIKDIYPQSALQAGMSSQVIDRCNIKTIAAVLEGRTYYENTLKAVMAVNADLIGGKLPDDGFYM